MTTWVFHFEGQIEVEAENDDQAVEIALDRLEKADISYWEVRASDPDHMT